MCIDISVSHYIFSTLLDILANRNKTGKLSGNILVNGVPIKKCPSFKRIAGYVFQDDKLMASLTVKESLMFAAGSVAVFMYIVTIKQI